MTAPVAPGPHPGPLPTLPGCVSGVVGQWRDERDRTQFALQCADCHEVEVPDVLVSMTFLCHHVTDRARRCRPCRVKVRAAQWPDCTCSLCAEDVTGSCYGFG